MSDKATKPKSRLGRGLNSLISLSTPEEPPVQQPALPATDAPADAVLASSAAPSDASADASAGVRILEIPLDRIVPNPHQPRRQFNEASLTELAASLKATGLIQPIVVRPGGDGSSTYQLIAGERRWRAARIAELPTVPVIVRDVDSATQAQMALIENIQREDLNPLDRAAAYQTLIKTLGLTQAELAGRLGEDRSTVTHFMRLLELAPPVQELVREGRLSLGHAKLLAGVSDLAEQQRLAQLVVEQNLSVRNLERVIQDTAPAPAAPAADEAKPAASAHLLDLERTLSHQLSLRVQIRPANKKGQGRVVLHYSSLDQFDELLSRLGVRLD